MSNASANAAKKNILLATITEGANSFEILGYQVWWNIRNVDLSKEQFAAMLEAIGLDKKYAIEHNYRSAFKRALKNLEEARIIRLVEEDEMKLVYQFTAETKVESKDEETSLEYEKETVVVVDKEEYRQSKDFKKSLIKGKETIKAELVKLFNIEKNRYHSSDITRYVQKIFRDRSDIISLRPQGSIYFVPASGKDVIDQIGKLLVSLGGGSSLDNFPVPNVESSKKLINSAVQTEIAADAETLEKELDAVLSGDKEVSKKWSQIRIDRVRNMLDRVEKYSTGGIIGTEDASKITLSMAELEKKIMGVRTIDLGDDDEEVAPAAPAANVVEPALEPVPAASGAA